MNREIFNLINRLSPADIEILRQALTRVETGGTTTAADTAVASTKSATLAADTSAIETEDAPLAKASITPTDSTANATVTKEAAPIITNTGDVVTFTLTLQNTSSGTLNNITVNDTITGRTFHLVPGTVTVNGSSVPDNVLYAAQDLGSLTAGNSMVVQFQAEVSSLSDGELYNSAHFHFINPDGNGETTYGDVSLWNTTAEKLTKSTDKSVAKPGEPVTYYLDYTNTTGDTITNVNLRDFIISGQSIDTIVPGSVVINGQSYPDSVLYTGVNLPDVPAGGTIHAQYQLKTDAAATSGTMLLNLAELYYTYYDPVTGQYYDNYLPSAVTATFISPAGFIGPQGPQGPQGPPGNCYGYSCGCGKTGYPSTSLYNKCNRKRC
ncbi:MAG: DUF11 domain-containing protein [Christensenellaceae bacterium]|jgi:uncharacterized repeat protein (TIGR01451 family)|nr:DUF11 domain-containing protein [Christensenellaceae bacterium]